LLTDFSVEFIKVKMRTGLAVESQLNAMRGKPQQSLTITAQNNFVCVATHFDVARIFSGLCAYYLGCLL
jgi:hypothetical protein